jgi:predicted nucleic acid-binding protein
MSDEKAVFVDTDVLVYAFDDSDSVRRAVAERVLIELMEKDRIRLSTQVLQEFYVAITERVGNPLSRSVALSITEELSAWPVVVVDYGLVRESILVSKDQRLSFWDSVALTSAVRSGAETLFSESLEHGRTLLGVRVLDPFQ